MSNNKISSEYNRVIVAELAKTYLVSKEYTERPECDVVSQDTLMIKRRIRYYIENVNPFYISVTYCNMYLV